MMSCLRCWTGSLKHSPQKRLIRKTWQSRYLASSPEFPNSCRNVHYSSEKCTHGILDNTSLIIPRSLAGLKARNVLGGNTSTVSCISQQRALAVGKSLNEGADDVGSATNSNKNSFKDEEYNEREDEFNEESSGFTNKHFIKLTPLQRAIITVGSGLSSFFDPTRAENIATFGEISAGLVLKRLYQRMMEDEEGQRILLQKPRINSKTVDLDYLSSLPDGTLGKTYSRFLAKYKITPDSRLPVRFIEDPELAYVMQRYREAHDLVHTVTSQPTNMLGEVVVKWIEGIQTGLPMCVTGGLFGATRLRPKQRQRYLNTHLKWAIEVGFTSKPFLHIFYEERWEQPLKELQHHISPKLLSPPPMSFK